MNRKPKRRLTRLIDGGSSRFTDAEHRVAYTLKHTYHCEKLRHSLLQRGMKVVELADLKSWNEGMSPNTSNADNLDPNFVYEMHPDQSIRSRKSPDVAWLVLAQKVMARRVDPREFIRAQFHTALAFKDPPWPNKFGTTESFENVRIAFEDFKSRYQHQYRYMLEFAVAEIRNFMLRFDDATEIEAKLSVMLDTENRLDSITRYCLAYQCRKEDISFKEVMKIYRVSAALDYVRFPRVYREVCKEGWLSPGLIRNSEKVYDKV